MVLSGCKVPSGFVVLDDLARPAIKRIDRGLRGDFFKVGTKLVKGGEALKCALSHVPIVARRVLPRFDVSLLHHAQDMLKERVIQEFLGPSGPLMGGHVFNGHRPPNKPCGRLK